jgi:hypothetical protein
MVKENDMARYIDLDALLEQIQEPMNWTDSDAELQEQLDYQSFKYLIEKQPIADVVPRAEIENAKQEGAREILDEFECHISTGIRILKDCINDKDTDQVKRHLLGRLHELCGMEKSIAELRKKYIGAVSIGKTGFLTKEEAEAKLKEIENESV